MTILKVSNLIIPLLTLYPIIKVIIYLAQECKVRSKVNKDTTMAKAMIGIWIVFLLLTVYSTVYYFLRLFDVYPSFGALTFGTASSIRTLLSNLAILALSLTFNRVISSN